MRLSRHLQALIVGANIMLTGCYQSSFKEEFVELEASGESDLDQAKVNAYSFPAEFSDQTLDCGLTGPRPLPVLDQSRREWFSRQWRAANEASLYEATKSEQHAGNTLRFSYIPSFHPSVFIRIEQKDQGFVLIAKQLDGAGGYEAGTLARSKEILLTDFQAAELQRMLSGRSIFHEATKICDSGPDGSVWIFERVQGQAYQMVYRSSPSDGAAYELGQLLIRLSGWDIDAY